MAPKNAYVVVMAGGSGTRFWPASREHRPKQFLKIGGDRSLLRQTVERVVDVVGWDRILIVTARVHAQHAQAELPELPAANLLVEPKGRNTAPCIAWANETILARDPGARVAVLPADHFIADEPGFRRHLEAALEAAAQNIVLLGITPTSPETGYGYIQRGMSHPAAGDVYKVARFVEKPDRPTAESYLSSGDYAWNSGMLVFPAPLMRAAIEEHLPELAKGLEALRADPGATDAIYPTLPSISIDYGVLEKARDVLVLPSSFGWSDVGSWDAVSELYAGRAPGDGNVTIGDALALGSKNVLVDARAGRLVVVIGAEDLTVVDSDGAVLVVKKGCSQDVKTVVEHLKTQDRKELL